MEQGRGSLKQWIILGVDFVGTGKATDLFLTVTDSLRDSLRDCHSILNCLLLIQLEGVENVSSFASLDDADGCRLYCIGGWLGEGENCVATDWASTALRVFLPLRLLMLD